MAFLQIGVIQTIACFFTFFAIMTEHGFPLTRLLGIRHDWDSKNVEDLKDAYGQEWVCCVNIMFKRVSKLKSYAIIHYIN